MNNIFCGMEKLSLVDFDGYLACTLFTGGCNYRCPFCHNCPLIHMQSPLEFEEILKFLNSRKKMLDAVVITGGEPTLHPILPDVIKKITRKNTKSLFKVFEDGWEGVALSNFKSNFAKAVLALEKSLAKAFAALVKQIAAITDAMVDQDINMVEKQ